MNLYRVKYAVKRGAASSGEWKYYEAVDRMRYDLLLAYLDAKREDRNGRRDWIKFVSFGAWRDFFKEDDKTYTNIFSVEKVVNDEWQPVDVEFVEPEVLIYEAKLGGTE